MLFIHLIADLLACAGYWSCRTGSWWRCPNRRPRSLARAPCPGWTLLPWARWPLDLPGTTANAVPCRDDV